jgi:hypothetical protein
MTNVRSKCISMHIGNKFAARKMHGAGISDASFENKCLPIRDTHYFDISAWPGMQRKRRNNVNECIRVLYPAYRARAIKIQVMCCAFRMVVNNYSPVPM